MSMREKKRIELVGSLNKALRALETVDCLGFDCNVCPQRVHALGKCLHDVVSGMLEV